MSIVTDPSDDKTPRTGDTLADLLGLRPRPLETGGYPVERHWYVDDHGYCAACNCAERNWRHAPRPKVGA